MLNKDLEKELNEVKDALKLEKAKNEEPLTGWNAYFSPKKG